MPTYEYSCPKCGVFEFVQSIKAEPLTACPVCGSPVKKLVGRNVMVLYKSGGFHNTDYRSSEYKAKAKQEQSVSASPTSPSPSPKASEKKAGD